MTGLDLHCFLPINGDSRQLVGGGHGVGTGSAAPLRQASSDYLARIAQAAEQVGFTGARTPTGAWCEDAWLTSAPTATSSTGRALSAHRGVPARRARPVAG